MKNILMACIFILAFGTTGVFAETIYLRDGKIVRGKIVREDDGSVMVETADSWQRIDRRTIELVDKDKDEVTQATTAPSAAQPVPEPVFRDRLAPRAIAPDPSRQDGSGYYLGFQIPYNKISGDFDGNTMPTIDSGIGFGLILGYKFDSQFGMEIDWAGSSHNSEGVDIGFGELSLNMKFSFLPEESARPFLFAGIGAFTLGDSSLTFGGTGYNLGIGVDFQMGEKNTIGLALIRKIITYDEIVKSDAPVFLARDLKGDTTSIRFDFTHHF